MVWVLGKGGGGVCVGFWNVCLESCRVPAALVCRGVEWRMVGAANR
jgi:hypothetical protein